MSRRENLIETIRKVRHRWAPSSGFTGEVALGPKSLNALAEAFIADGWHQSRGAKELHFDAHDILRVHERSSIGEEDWCVGCDIFVDDFEHHLAQVINEAFYDELAKDRPNVTEDETRQLAAVLADTDMGEDSPGVEGFEDEDIDPYLDVAVEALVFVRRLDGGGL